MALASEEPGREIVEVYLQAMRKGDWRAAEALMSRIYGKPEAAVVAHVPPNPALPVLKSMSSRRSSNSLVGCEKVGSSQLLLRLRRSKRFRRRG
jgi:hypothetical protein